MASKIEQCFFCDKMLLIPSRCRECGAENKGKEGRKQKVVEFWGRVEKVWGPEGMPSCGMTDAARIGNGDGDSPTVYLGGRNED